MFTRGFAREGPRSNIHEQILTTANTQKVVTAQMSARKWQRKTARTHDVLLFFGRRKDWKIGAASRTDLKTVLLRGERQNTAAHGVTRCVKNPEEAGPQKQGARWWLPEAGAGTA